MQRGRVGAGGCGKAGSSRRAFDSPALCSGEQTVSEQPRPALPGHGRPLTLLRVLTGGCHRPHFTGGNTEARPLPLATKL